MTDMWIATGGFGGSLSPEPPGGDHVGKINIIGQPTNCGRPAWRTGDLIVQYTAGKVGRYTTLVEVVEEAEFDPEQIAGTWWGRLAAGCERQWSWATAGRVLLWCPRHRAPRRDDYPRPPRYRARVQDNKPWDTATFERLVAEMERAGLT